MFRDLFGNDRYDPSDAAKVAKKLLDKEILHRIDFSETEKGVSTEISLHEDKVTFNKPGIYAIYNHDGCVYVGQTSESIIHRIYRFGKELAGKSRHDEGHPGARRARELGYTINDVFHVKAISTEDLLRKVDARDPEYSGLYGHFPIDEWIASLLDSICNLRKAR